MPLILLAAWAARRERDEGSIEPGKVAGARQRRFLPPRSEMRSGRPVRRLAR